MHNGSSPSGNEKWYPKNINVRHIKWSMENYLKELSKIDIGIAPNNMIHNDEQMKQNETASAYNYSPDDYSLRFKMPSNPGRFLIYGKLGVPCVADFYPSALQLLDGENGFVAHNIGIPLPWMLGPLFIIGLFCALKVEIKLPKKPPMEPNRRITTSITETPLLFIFLSKLSTLDKRIVVKRNAKTNIKITFDIYGQMVDKNQTNIKPIIIR